jgi:hypothetical protein
MKLRSDRCSIFEYYPHGTLRHYYTTLHTVQVGHRRLVDGRIANFTVDA